MTSECEACGEFPSALRRCTGQVLCGTCRRAPEHRILTHAEAKKAGLDEASLRELVAGRRVNRVLPYWKKARIYLWQDVALGCLERGLPLP